MAHFGDSKETLGCFAKNTKSAKIGEISRRKNGCRKRAPKLPNGSAKSDFSDLRNATEIWPNRGNWEAIKAHFRKPKETLGCFAKNPESAKIGEIYRRKNGSRKRAPKLPNGSANNAGY